MLATGEGMFQFIQKHFLRHVFPFYLTFIHILRYFGKVPCPPKRTKMIEKMINLASKSVFCTNSNISSHVRIEKNKEFKKHFAIFWVLGGVGPSL